MHRLRFSVWVRSVVLWAVLGGVCSVRAQEPLDTLRLFRPHTDTIRSGFEDTLPISTDGQDWHYFYLWNINDEDVSVDRDLDIFFTGQRKNKVRGSRARRYSFRYDISQPLELKYEYFVQDPIDYVSFMAFPEYKDSNASWNWRVVDERGDTYTSSGDFYIYDTWGLEVLLNQILKLSVSMRCGRYSKTASVKFCFWGKTGKTMRLPASKGGKSYHLNVFDLDADRICCRPNDTLYLDAKMKPEDSSFSVRYTLWETTSLTEEELNDPHSSSQIVFFRGERYRDNLSVTRRVYRDGVMEQQSKKLFIYWGIDPNRIETDSVWVFFPQYPYSNLGGRVDICLPHDAPLPAASDTVQVFNLGPWNRELEYVEYAWLDGTKDIAGADSVVGTDSVFYYTFGKMDSVSPELYAGALVARVAADSLWQDSCNCFVQCTDDACHRYDTVQIYLHLLPSLKENVFLPDDTTLCAHLDLELQLPKESANYHCFWLDQDSVALPYGYDTARYTVQGMRGLDGYGAGTDTREPRFFQLRLDHKLCGVSFFDTLLVYDQVKPIFELACHDTLICLDEPVEMDSLSPQVYHPFYVFEWNDGTKGSEYTFTDSGVYVLQFFVGKDFAVCGYDTASDTVRVRWSDPAQTLITLEDTSFCEKLSVTLDASVPCPTTLYCWQDGPIPDPEEDFGDETDSIIFSSVSVKVFKEEGTYNISLLDTMGCINRKQIEVTIEDCSPKLEIPNVFTPNGDGVNDVWRFKQLEYCTDVKVEVVDRWGQPVLKTKVATATDFEWNGTINNKGRRLPDGPYFYMVTYKDVYGKSKVQSGSITILGTAE